MADVMNVPGYSYGPQESNHVGFDNVAPGYFAAMGIPLLAGEDFDERHYGEGNYGFEHIIVNESFAKHYWPGRDPIGQPLLFKGRFPSRVIGVVRDTRDKSLLAPGEPRYFIAMPEGMFTLVVRTDGPADVIAPMLRNRIANLGLGIKRARIDLGQDIRGKSLRAASITSETLTALTVLALALASLGLYGLVAFTVERRTREIGVRLALGARPSDIYSLATAITLRPAIIGLGAGSVAAVGVAQFATSIIVNGGAFDLPILLGTIGVLGVVVAVSAFVPARRAMRIEPSIALRNM
jgi:hypothetical protein